MHVVIPGGGAQRWRRDLMLWAPEDWDRWLERDVEEREHEFAMVAATGGTPPWPTPLSDLPSFPRRKPGPTGPRGSSDLPKCGHNDFRTISTTGKLRCRICEREAVMRYRAADVERWRRVAREAARRRYARRKLSSTTAPSPDR